LKIAPAEGSEAHLGGEGAMSFRNEKTLKDATSVGNKTGLVSLNIKQRAEVVTVYTMLLNNGLLFYSVNAAPQNQYRNYEGAFQNMPRSVNING
jgi:hypothetical protein